MAVLSTIRSLFSSAIPIENETVVPAPLTAYAVKPLTEKHAKEVLKLNLRCFRNGENYTKHTFNYLFTEPNILSYQAIAEDGQMAGFVFVILNKDGTAHLTTIGVAPEHRRRGVAGSMLGHVEAALIVKGISTIVLEVRVQNVTAQTLYTRFGYSTVKRITKYYADGEDCYLMVKSLV